MPMPILRALWWLTIAVTVISGVWLVGQVAHRSAPPAAPAQPASTAPLAIGFQQTPDGQAAWFDPSVDPEILKRAYAPPGPLPPEARPFSLRTQPSDEEWAKLRKENAMAY